MPRTSKQQAAVNKESDAGEKLVSKLANQLNSASVELTDDLLADILAKAIDRIPNDGVKSHIRDNRDRYLQMLKAKLVPQTKRETATATSISSKFYAGPSSSRAYLKVHVNLSENNCLSVEDILSSMNALHVDFPDLAQTILRNKSLFHVLTPSVTSLATRILSLVILQNGAVDEFTVFLLSFAVAHISSLTPAKIISTVAGLKMPSIYSFLAFLSYWVKDETSSCIASLIASLISQPTLSPPSPSDLISLLILAQWTSKNEHASLQNLVVKHFAVPGKAHKLIAALLDISSELPVDIKSAKSYIAYCLTHDDMLTTCRKYILGTISRKLEQESIEDEPVVSFFIDNAPRHAHSEPSVEVDDSDIPTCTSVLKSLGDFGKDEVEETKEAKKSKKKSKRVVEEIVSDEVEVEVPKTASKRTRKPRSLD